MGRPEPCVLFAHSFVHSQLDEYADEVLFAEPVVITACEFLEQNASPSTPNISLVGATSPPSFALEIFIHCEGESRFRRLCQPFLYSHSSSSVLEVEAVVTNHLVLRGSYRSLTLVVYGNTAEDLGQFNIEFDLDSSLANAVRSPPEGKFEDLPSALCLTKLTFEESISSIKSLCYPVPELEIAPELKKFLQLILKVLQVSDYENTLHKVVDSVVSAVSSDVHNDSNVPASWDKQNLCKGSNKGDSQQVVRILSEARNELLKLYKIQQPASVDNLSLEDELYIGSDDMVSSELLIDMFNQCFPCFGKTGVDALTVSSEKKNLILGLGVALLLCTCRESCFCFVTSGAMEQIVNLLSPENPKSTAVALLLLGVVERATRHAMGCEGFLGWWPREDEDVPIGNSDGYCHLLKLLLEKQRHDVASLATYVLHRLRFYEVASRYESAVLSVLARLSVDSQIAKDEMESLITASSLLKQILKLLDFLGPIEDPSPLASARKLYLDSQSEGLLSYGATVDIIGSCKYSFEKWDIDTHLLFLLKERGFFPLSAALLSSPILRSADGSTADAFLEIATSIESLLLKLLFSRSGLTFLLIQPEATALLVLSLQDLENTSKMECMTLRQAAVFLLKGFVCRPQEIGMIIELHLRVGTAIDRILVADPHSDDFLWVLWELCAISRSDCGRQALLALCHFPEAVRVLMEALRSFKSLEPSESGSSSLSLAIFHFAAEIFEIMVTDSTASSLKCWIEHAVELHKALHLSSPGSNRKDAPTRLLEWIDAGVVYHRNGAVGLLRYAAVLVSGGDAHLTSASVLVSDSIDVENVLGDSINSSDDQVVDNMLGKLVSDKYFEGISFPDASVVQLTTTFRILAFISENSVVAASLFEEGALTLIYVVLVNCKLMLERSSNTYDYLVDEGAECNSTSDLLSGRSHEQSLVDLMIPCLVLLINLLHKLQEAKEQYRNKKLLNTLLHLHREISPRLVACAADLSYPYPSSALAFGAVCHLISSALACWPVFGWSPGLFHCLLESVQAASSLALGPKDACSMFCLLGDLLPEEGIWLWKNEMPPLSALKTLSVGTVLGPQAEGHINWYQRPEHLSVLLVRLTPQLDRIAQIVFHLAFTALVAIQDMLRVFIIRMACQRTECAVVLLRPVVSWMEICVNNTSPSDIDIFKVHRFLCFLASLLEHPRSKTLLLKVGAMQILEKVLQRCSDAFCSNEKLILDERVSSKNVSLLSWSLPVFRCLALIYSSQTPMCRSQVCCNDNISIEESCLVSRHLLQLCQVLPVGQELLTCIVTLKEIASCGPGRGAILSIFSQIHSSLQEHKLDQEGTNGGLPSDYYWGMSPFLNCLKKLSRSLESKDSALTIVVETVYALSLCTIYVSKEGKSSGGVSVLKSLYGLPNDLDDSSVSSDEKLNDVVELLRRIQQMIAENEYLTASNWTTTLNQVKESVEAVLLLLQSTAGASSTIKGIALSEGSNFPSDIVHSVIITSKLMPSLTKISMDDKPTLSFSHVWKSNENAEKVDDDFAIESLAEKFVWECPYTLPERPLMPALPSKRKPLAAEGSGKRARENIGSEAIGSNALARGLSTANASSGPTRRDNFRLRKPNTSRPPSMHVDDYVARERSIDGVSSGLNIVSSQRVTSTSGRPPSIHVDEFMARQRERQNPMPGTNGDTSQVRNSSFENAKDPDKLDRSRQLKLDPDDDLQGIDIVFDEESESDDRLPFPQPDDNMQPAPVVIGDSSPGSVVEETEGDTIGGTRISHSNTLPAFEDGGSHSDLALRKPVYRTEIPVAQEASVSSEKNLKVVGIEKLIFHEQSDESKYISPVGGLKGSEMLPTSNLTVFPPSLFNPVSTSSSVPPLLPPSYHQRGSPQKSADASIATRSQGYSEQKIPINQPPLPPMPPPTLAAVPAQSADQTASHSSPYVHSLRDAQPPIPSGYPLQHFDISGINTVTGLHLRSENLPSSGSSSISSLSTAQPILDSKYSWNMVSSAAFSSSVSARPMPPLPPTPPPFSSSIAQAIASNSNPQNSSYNQVANVGVQPPLPSTPISDARLGILSASGTSLASYSLPPFTPPSLTSRPTSVPGTQFSSPSQKQSQNSPSLSQPVLSPLLSIQSIQPRPPPPPPPPQLPRPLNLPQQPGPFIHPQSEQGIPMQQSTIQVQVQPLQVQQQLHMPQIQFYYQQQQQEPLLQPLQPLLEQAQLQNTNIPFDNAAQQESGMTLQQYFSPEAIQALLRDRDKLCQLLEQHPKLMQMLQERLGQQ